MGHKEVTNMVIDVLHAQISFTSGNIYQRNVGSMCTTRKPQITCMLESSRKLVRSPAFTEFLGELALKM